MNSVAAVETAGASPGKGSEVPPYVGAFRILRVLDSDASGTSYEAAQENPNRIVTLRVLNPIGSVEELARRAEREADRLKRLHHPGLADIYEVGHVPNGYGPRVFCVTEPVRGKPILEYARENSLRLPERLELLLQLCDAMNYAHQKGVMHCDLRPTKVFVDETGRAKIGDTGLAVLLEGDCQAAVLDERGNWAAALPYMSPEQRICDWRDLNTQCDVYSLGVIGYELLCGRLPFPVEGMSLARALRTIHDETPPPPSCADRALGGELDAILMKALARQRGDRYATAAALADDLRAYLADEPVSAHPRTTGYQLHKFARRHRVLVAGAACVVGALVAGVVGTSVALYSAQGRKHLIDKLQSEKQELAVQHKKLSQEKGLLEAEGLLAQAGAVQAERPADAHRLYDAALEKFGTGGPSWVVDATLATLYRSSPPPLNEFVVPGPQIQSIDFIPGRTLVRVRDTNGGTSCWDLRTGRAQKSAESPPTSPARAGMVCTCRGGRTVGIDKHGRLACWDKAGDEPIEFAGDSQAEGILSLALSADGTYALSGNKAGEITVWDVGRHSQVAKFQAHRMGTSAAAFCSSGKTLTALTGSDDGTLKLWDVLKRERSADLPGHRAGISCITVTDDGLRALSGDVAGTVKVWDLTTRSVIFTLTNFDGAVKCITISPDGRFAAVGYSDERTSRVVVWTLQPSGPVQSIASSIIAGSCSADGLRLVYSGGNQMQVRDAQTGQTMTLKDGTESMVGPAVAISTDGTRVVTGAGDGTLRIWDAKTGRLLCSRTAHSGSAVRQVAISKDGKRVLSGGEDRVAVAWDESLRPLTTFDRSVSPVTFVAFAAEGKVISGGSDALYLWQLTGANEVSHVQVPQLSSLALSSDKKLALCGSTDGTVSLCDLETHTSKPLYGHHEQVTAVAFGPDDQWALSADRAGGVKLWGLSGEGPRSVGMLGDLDGAPVAMGSTKKGWWVICSSGTAWDFSWPHRYRDWKRRFKIARSAGSLDPGLLSEWYRFRGVIDWAK